MMGAQPKVSIIVPIYKVEDCLDRCVESLVHQTYTDIEILLVNDGSPDRCPKLCDSWAERDGRIRVIHKKNGGLSDARNAGIEEAAGEYFLFIDGDDYVRPDMCEKMISAAEKNQSDMVISSFIWKYPDKEIVQSMCTGKVPQCFSNIEMLKIFFMKKTIELSVAWNKLYRRDLFFTSEDIRYPVGKLHEDEFTTYKLIYAAHNVTILPEALYYYVQRNTSIMSAFSQRNLLDSIEAAESYIPWHTEHHLSLKKEIACAYDILSYAFYLRYLHDNRIDPQRREIDRFRTFIMENTPSVYLTSGVPLKYRIWDFLLRTNTIFIYRWMYILKTLCNR